MPNRGFTNEGSVGADIADNILSQTTGLFSTKPTAKYTSGARTTLKINNQLIGFAFNISWRIITDNTEIKTIDDYMPYEFVPNRIMVEGTLGAFHIPGAGASAQLIQANVLSFLFHKYITIEVRDSATDEILFLTNRAVVVSRSEDLSSERLGQTQLTWRAIGWEDEIKPALPPDADTELQSDQSAITRFTGLNPVGNDAVSKFFK